MNLPRALRLPVLVLFVFAALAIAGTIRASGVRNLTGAVVEWQAGQWISVANEQTDPQGVRIDLRDVRRDDNRGAIGRGARVAVSYRSVGERYPVAVDLRVLDPR